MSDRDSRYRVELDVNAGQQTERAAPLPDTPFNIAILGDFRAAASVQTGDFKPILIDRDNVDEVVARLAPLLRVSVGADAQSGGEINMRFSELDDFHPDRLLQRVPALNAIWELRKRLADPRTFASAARELGGAQATPAPAPAASRAAASGSLLEDILADVPGPALEPVRAREDDLQTLVRSLVTPHVVAGQDPRQSELVGQVDAVLLDSLRALMQLPSFQALEANWRAVDFITRRLDTDSTLHLYLIDVSRAALSADLAGGGIGFQRLATAGVNGVPWAVFAGCYTFGPTAQDAELLGQIARAASAAGVAFIAAADTRLAGCPSPESLSELEAWNAPVDPAWTALRRAPESSHVSLALPRFLLRVPYGKNSEPCDSLPFEENPEAQHQHFLWGNPAIACALLLGESFQREGWQLRPGMDANIDGLPMHVMRRSGEASVLPCAESLMTDRAAARLIECGLTPLASLKDQDGVRLVRFQSLAGRALSGPWQ